jgi:transcriptional regulator with XRE-family HTH domain
MNNIKKLRTAKGLTMQDLAKITGYSERQLYYLQNGEKQPTIRLARLIAYVLTGKDDIRKVWP